MVALGHPEPRAWGIKELPPEALGEPQKPRLYLPSEQPNHRLFLGQSGPPFSWCLLSPEGPRSAGFRRGGGGHRRRLPRRSLPHWAPSMLSRVWLCYPTTVAHQAPQPMGFLRQEYWSRLPFPPLGDFPWPRDWTRTFYVSCIGRWMLYHCAAWEVSSLEKPKTGWEH